jgi:ectoine hydroxylase-related dioxygenase (phytanoyl-CoA dioxygenase family)
MNTNMMGSQIDVAGFAIVENAVDDSNIAKLVEHFAGANDSDANRQRKGNTFGMRNLLRDHAIVRELADSPAMRALIEPVLGADAIAVRGILFDKTPGANWTVPWHQDLSIAVTRREEVPGFGPWSVKAEVPHVQPPVAVLRNMLTVRLHLDDCGMDNGPLLVIAKSHADGVLSADAVETHRKSGNAVACVVERGGALLMRRESFDYHAN